MYTGGIETRPHSLVPDHCGQAGDWRSEIDLPMRLIVVEVAPERHGLARGFSGPSKGREAADLLRSRLLPSEQGPVEALSHMLDMVVMVCGHSQLSGRSSRERGWRRSISDISKSQNWLERAHV